MNVCLGLTVCVRCLRMTLCTASHGVLWLSVPRRRDGRIENIDLTNIVSGHMEYPDKLEEILVRGQRGPGCAGVHVVMCDVL